MPCKYWLKNVWIYVTLREKYIDKIRQMLFEKVHWREYEVQSWRDIGRGGSQHRGGGGWGGRRQHSSSCDSWRWRLLLPGHCRGILEGGDWHRPEIHWKDGLWGRPLSVCFLFRTSGKPFLTVEKSHVHQERGATKPSDLADVLFQIWKTIQYEYTFTNTQWQYVKSLHI